MFKGVGFILAPNICQLFVQGASAFDWKGRDAIRNDLRNKSVFVKSLTQCLAPGTDTANVCYLWALVLANNWIWSYAELQILGTVPQLAI